MKFASRVQPFAVPTVVVSATKSEAEAMMMDKKLDKILERKDLSSHEKTRRFEDAFAKLTNYKIDNGLLQEDITPSNDTHQMSSTISPLHATKSKRSKKRSAAVVVTRNVTKKGRKAKAVTRNKSAKSGKSVRSTASNSDSTTAATISPLSTAREVSPTPAAAAAASHSVDFSSSLASLPQKSRAKLVSTTAPQPPRMTKALQQSPFKASKAMAKYHKQLDAVVSTPQRKNREMKLREESGENELTPSYLRGTLATMGRTNNQTGGKVLSRLPVRRLYIRKWI